MHDLTSLMLLQQSHAIPKSGEELETLGKYAAKKYVEGSCASLNDAVVETVKHAGLSPEQVKRVVEFANTDAYLTEYRKEASSKYVTFLEGPADPAEVLRDLNDGGGGTVFDRGLADYSVPPGVKTASAVESFEKQAAIVGFGPSMSDIASDMSRTTKQRYNMPAYSGFDPFGEHEKRHQVAMLSAITGRSPVVVKQAEAELLDFDPAETALKQAFAAEDPELPYAEPLAPALELHDKLAGAAEEATYELSALEGGYRDALEGLYQSVKAASLEGLTLGQVVAAWKDVVPDGNYVKTAFSHIGPRLVQEEVFLTLDDLGASLEKTAHTGTVNPEHPLVAGMGEYCLLLEKLAETRAARDELLLNRDALSVYLKEAGVMRAAGEAVGRAVKGVADSGGVVPKVYKASRAAGNAAGAATKGTGEFLFGTGSRGAETAGKVVREGIAHSPTAVAGVGALVAADELHDRAKYSPTFQSAKNFAMSRVPYTHQNMVREHQLAMRGQY
jgi:hypothetical protein